MWILIAVIVLVLDEVLRFNRRQRQEIEKRKLDIYIRNPFKDNEKYYKVKHDIRGY